MRPFPSSMRNPANLIATTSQHTQGVEGYVFDGADGSQMAFWTVVHDAVTAEHVHEFDEWFIVVEGSYDLTLDGKEVHIGAGQECFIPKGTRIAGRVTAGTRTVHAFGGKRAQREPRSTTGDHAHRYWQAFSKRLSGVPVKALRFQRPPGRLFESNAFQGDIVSLWAARRSKPWNRAFCGKGDGRECGILSAIAFDLGGYPYPEYMNIDSTVWVHSQGWDLELPDDAAFEQWIFRCVEPLRLQVAVEHENDGFAGLPPDELAVLAPQRGKEGRGIDYSVQKLAHVRAPLRVLICYPSAKQPLATSEIDEVADAASKRIQRIVSAQVTTSRTDEWLCIMGFLEASPAATRVAWRHQVF